MTLPHSKWTLGPLRVFFRRLLIIVAAAHRLAGGRHHPCDSRLCAAVALLFIGAAVSSPSAIAQSVCPNKTGESAIQCIQENYSPTGTLGYDRARDTLYASIDAEDIDSDGADELVGLYSGYTITLDPSTDPSTDAFNKGMNAEHVFPQSKGAGTEPRKSDMHNLYPANSGVNSARSNVPFGESPDAQTDDWYVNDRSRSSTPSSNIDAYSERQGATIWEPREEQEGDVARAALYFYTLYRPAAEDAFFDGMRTQLLEWHKQDPVTQAEEERSAAIAAEQGNENPFALDETLAERAFGTSSGPTLVFDPTEVSVGEPDGSATLTVRYDSPDGNQVEADIAFQAGASTASTSDIGGYSTQTVTFSASAPDGATRTVTVPVTDDDEAEGTEEALFEITGVTTSGDAQAGTSSSVALQIQDDERPLVVNEALADPPAGTAGDANQDGTRSATDDEFVEIYNTSASAGVDLAGHVLVDDGIGTRHVFPEGTVLGPEEAVVVFGGGSPSGSIPGIVQTASSGRLGLNNGGDSFTLRNGAGTTILTYDYDGSISDESRARDPDFTGGFVAHSSASGSGGDLFSPGRSLSGTPLPVELADFEGTTTRRGVALTWQTASETDNAGFNVQRKTEAGTWNTIQFVEGGGTDPTGDRYQFTDTDLPHAVDVPTYRLEQVDTDGSTHVSDEITVRRNVTEVQLRKPFPNPASRAATVQYALPRGQAVTMRLYDTLGRQVRTVVNERKQGRHAQPLDVRGLASGVYVLRLQAGGQMRTQRLTVVR